MLVYVHDEASNASTLHIYNARTMDAKPVAVLRLPARVPYGFHGMFVDEAALAAQLRADA
jgi:carotenoid cleavage dioxygenase-like enzyme